VEDGPSPQLIQRATSTSGVSIKSIYSVPKDCQITIQTGRLSDLWTPEGDDFFQSGQLASKPLRLGLSTTMRTITCGRSFMTGLDSKGEIWCFTNWGRPFIYAPSILDRTYQGSEITQVECGWSYSAALTASGMVVVWNPINEEMKHSSHRKRKIMDRIMKRKAPETEGVIRCDPSIMKGAEALVLPELPSLPSLNADQVENYRLIKIAAGDLFIIGLTNGGHVLKLDLGGINERDAVRQLTDLFQQRARGWQYVSLKILHSISDITILVANVLRGVKNGSNFRVSGRRMCPSTATGNHTCTCSVDNVIERVAF
jgi:hypothetical protein